MLVPCIVSVPTTMDTCSRVYHTSSDRANDSGWPSVNGPGHLSAWLFAAFSVDALLKMLTFETFHSYSCITAHGPYARPPFLQPSNLLFPSRPLSQLARPSATAQEFIYTLTSGCISSVQRIPRKALSTERIFPCHCLLIQLRGL